MGSENNVLAFKGGVKCPPLSERSRRLVSGCRQLLAQTLIVLMDGLFETLDDALYGLADRSDNTKSQTVYFDAMRLLRKQRGHIQDHFLARVLTNFDGFWGHGLRDVPLPTPPLQSGSGLSLLEEDDLEASLAVTAIISKGENRFHREISRLNLRFSLVLADSDINANNNPLGPASICVPFHNAIQNLALDVQVRLVIYKLFDKQLVQHFGCLYDEVNRLFKQAGIDPISSLETSSKPNDNASRSNAGSALHSKHPEVRSVTSPRSKLDESQKNVFNTFQALLGNYRGINTEAQLSVGGGPTIDQSELLVALSELQRRRGIAAQDYDAKNNSRDVRSQLSEHLSLQQNGNGQRTLAQADQDTLDIIAMLFDFLLTDPHLPDALKALIARLQIPLLKVAILDKTFFNGNQHPARRLLNNLAHAAAAWSDDGDRSLESLYGHISSIVQKVISSFEDDPGVFAQLNKEFAIYLEREQRLAEATEQRTNQITRGKEQLKQAKERIASEITKRLSTSQRIPLVASALLEEGWKDVLLLTYLRQGPESAAWKEQLTVADRLLWSVQPKADQEQRQSLLQAIPDLLAKLHEGLNGISYDQHRMMRLLEELQICHLACLRGNEYFQIQPELFRKASPKQVPAQQPSAVANATIDGQDNPESGKSDQAVEDLARGLAIGSWLEISESDDRRVRVKLSWKNAAGNAYVFVNRKGIKVLEMTMGGVIRLFRSGQAKLLSDMDVPIVDRAVEAVLTNLQKAKAKCCYS